MIETKLVEKTKGTAKVYLQPNNIGPWVLISGLEYDTTMYEPECSYYLGENAKVVLQNMLDNNVAW
jgi:hypothetical protein